MTGYIPLDTDKWPKIIKGLDKYSSIVIGSGLAKSPQAKKLVLAILSSFNGPIVLDGDAINVLTLKEDSDVFTMRNAPTVLTPHFEEFARFVGVEKELVQEKIITYLQETIQKIGSSFILKGASCTYLALSDGKVYF